METDELITILVADLRPVRRLGAPERRLLLWLALSALYMVATVFALGLRPDIGIKVHDPRFALEAGGAIATAIFAGLAAFCAACPGWPRWTLFAPAPALAIWIGTLIEPSARAWMISAAWPGAEQDVGCIPTILALAALPGALIGAMIRRSVPLSPGLAGGLAALAAAALAAAAVRFVDPKDSGTTILIWQFGSVVALTVTGVLLGRWRLGRRPIRLKSA